MCIGFDRHARMRFLMRYSLVVTKRRVSVALIGISLLSFIQAMLYVCGTNYDVFKKMKQVAVGIDFTKTSVLVIVYLITLKIPRDYHMNFQNRDFLSKTDRIASRLASKNHTNSICTLHCNFNMPLSVG